MNIEARKISIAQMLFNIQKEDVLDKIEALLNRETKDWYDELTEEQKASIARAREDVKAGRTTPHEEVKKEIRQMIENKRTA